MIFSVVIPLYNKQESICTTLDSVVAQTFRDFEIVVVDDGSTDASWDKVRNYAITHSEVSWHLLQQTNQGVSAARNRGVLAAKGKYIAFLDADDLWVPTYLEKLNRLIADFPNMGLYVVNYVVEKDGVQSSTINKLKLQRGVINNPWQVNAHPFWTGSSSSSRENIIKVGLFDTRITHGEDLDMWWRLLLLAGGAEEPEPLAVYRCDAENRASVRTIPLETFLPYYMEKFIKAREDNAEFRRYFDTHMVYRLYPYLFDKNYRSEGQRLAAQIDYSQLKPSMYWRMKLPYLYKLYKKISSCCVK